MIINIYKIRESNNIENLKDLLIENEYEEKQLREGIDLYIRKPQPSDIPSWLNNLSKDFEISNIEEFNPTSLTNGMLIIDSLEGENTFVIPFGTAFHLLGQTIDIDFPISFLERISWKTINHLTIDNPNSLVNRKINNYKLTNKNILLAPGESMKGGNLKLSSWKLGADDNEGLKVFSKIVSLGEGIKFTLKNSGYDDALNNIILLLEWIVKIYSMQPINKIERMRKLESSKIDEFKDKFYNEVFSSDSKLDEMNINFEYKGNSIIFNEDLEMYVGSREENNKIDFSNLKDSLKSIYENSDMGIEEFFNLSLYIKDENDQKIKSTNRTLFSKINYQFDEKVIIMNGVYYEYNESFIEKINSWIIAKKDKIKYKEKFNINNESELAAFVGKREEKLIEWIKKEMLGMNGFDNIENLDQDFIMEGRSKYEIADLYFQVEEVPEVSSIKIGEGSSKLGYNIDQSLISLSASDEKNYIDKLGDKGLSKPDKFSLWFYLTSNFELFVDETYLLEKDTKLIFKIKLVDWMMRMANEDKEFEVYFNKFKK